MVGWLVVPSVGWSIRPLFGWLVDWSVMLASKSGENGFLDAEGVRRSEDEGARRKERGRGRSKEESGARKGKEPVREGSKEEKGGRMEGRFRRNKEERASSPLYKRLCLSVCR